MSGDPYPVFPDHFIAASMHQSCIGHSKNRDTGLAVVSVGPGKFRVSKLGLFGCDRWVTIRWNRHGQFDILAPLRKTERR